MRLLHRDDTGEFRLTQDLVGDDQITWYAILSQRWLKGTEEPTFEDLINDTGLEKPAYAKIRLCGEQASLDGLRYFWIDTCCINKASYSKHSRAINSMFRWYRNAARCYVYLPDVSKVHYSTITDFNRHSWASDFWNSEWFTRGWTLQELLAPCVVEFFSYKHKRLDDRSSLKQKIQEITGISASALQGASLSEFTVKERIFVDKAPTDKGARRQSLLIAKHFRHRDTPILYRRVVECLEQLLMRKYSRQRRNIESIADLWLGVH
jgi:hypothetical protein